MKNIKKETIEEASDAQLTVWLNDLNRRIVVGTIEWINAKGEDVVCPWRVFNQGGSIVAAKGSVDWDLGRRVQVRAEAERQHAGNAIASFKSVLHAKSDTLTATVRTNGLIRVNCEVCDQLAEALSVISNAAKLAKELSDRAERDEDGSGLAEANAEREAVAAFLKARHEAARAAAKAKADAEEAVKGAFNPVITPETNGQLVGAGA